MAKIVNDRFPHNCTIYRMTGVTPFDDGIKTIVYDGRCRKDLVNASFRKVIESKYQLSIPGTLSGINKGDSVDIQDANGTYISYIVMDSNPGNLGTTVYIDSTSTNNNG